MNTEKQEKLMDTENKLMVARQEGVWGMSEKGERN